MKKFLSILLLSVLTLPGFAKNSILIIGDSLSAGYGMNINQGWVALLKDKLATNGYHYTVINASISGDTTRQGLARMPDALSLAKPQITIIELGGNDGLRGLPLSTIKNNLQHMIQLAQHANSKVLLLGVRLPPNYGEAYTTQFQQLFAELARQDGISVVAQFLKNIDTHANLMQPDHTHPTALAQPLLLDNVWPVLQPLLKK